MASAPRMVLFGDTRICSPPVSPPSGVGGIEIIPLTRIVSGPGVLSLAYKVNWAKASLLCASTTTRVPASGAPPPVTPPSSNSVGAASIPPSHSPPRSLIVAKPMSWLGQSRRNRRIDPDCRIDPRSPRRCLSAARGEGRGGRRSSWRSARAPALLRNPERGGVAPLHTTETPAGWQVNRAGSPGTLTGRTGTMSFQTGSGRSERVSRDPAAVRTTQRALRRPVDPAGTRIGGPGKLLNVPSPTGLRADGRERPPAPVAPQTPKPPLPVAAPPLRGRRRAGRRAPAG